MVRDERKWALVKTNGFQLRTERLFAFFMLCLFFLPVGGSVAPSIGGTHKSLICSGDYLKHFAALQRDNSLSARIQQDSCWSLEMLNRNMLHICLYLTVRLYKTWWFIGTSII